MTRSPPSSTVPVLDPLSPPHPAPSSPPSLPLPSSNPPSESPSNPLRLRLRPSRDSLLSPVCLSRRSSLSTALHDPLEVTSLSFRRPRPRTIPFSHRAVGAYTHPFLSSGESPVDVGGTSRARSRASAERHSSISSERIILRWSRVLTYIIATVDLCAAIFPLPAAPAADCMLHLYLSFPSDGTKLELTASFKVSLSLSTRTVAMPTTRTMICTTSVLAVTTF